MIKKMINEYVLNNKYDIYILLSILLIGVFIGVLGFVFLNYELRTEFISEVKNVFDISKQEGFDGANVIIEGIKSNLLTVILLIFLSITLLCKAGIYLITLVKGISLGLYICSIFTIFGFLKGLLIFFLLVVLVNIIYIPAYIYISTKLMNFNFEIFKSKRDSINMLNILKIMILVTIGFFVMFSGTIFEQIFSKIAINIYNSIY